MLANKLFEILQSDIIKIYGSLDLSIRGINIDSRLIETDHMFVALVGSHVDGHQYINQAIKNGARLIVVEKEVENSDNDCTVVVVKNTKNIAGKLVSIFYGNDSKDYKLIGVTGTNGKSTVATLGYQLFTKLGYKCGLISTVENLIGTDTYPSTHTTPDIVSLGKLIFDMREANCTYIFMEVSSHGLDQGRVEGLEFDVAIFTNISHDHLDYHGDMKSYISAKKILFDGLSHSAFALVNKDDVNGNVMLQNCKAKAKTYSLRSLADFRARLLNDSLIGMQLQFNGQDLFCKLSGAFNAYNLLAVYGTAILLGENEQDVLIAISSLEGAKGRMQKIILEGVDKIGIVDYAHTPDALQNILDTINKTKNSNSKVITVIGCGGDRDKTKRPIMAKVGAKCSSQLILTSDNPRSEDPEKILDEMEEGLNQEETNKMIRIADRKSAIKVAVSLAGNDDIILVAGKGHEKYQEIHGIKHPFDDAEILKNILKN